MNKREETIFIMIALLVAFLFPGACGKTNPESEQPHHNTTYVWGFDYWDEVWPADKVAASADSTLVDFVILECNGASWKGLPTSTVIEVLTPVIESGKPENRHKIRGAGTLNDVDVSNDKAYQDSITLANMGFKFGRVYSLYKP